MEEKEKEKKAILCHTSHYSRLTFIYLILLVLSKGDVKQDDLQQLFLAQCYLSQTFHTKSF